MNILMLTSVYPHSDDSNTNATKVVQYFTREWVKQGHRVTVIHDMHRYPSIVHGIPRKIKGLLATRLGFDIPDLSDVREFCFEDEGVKVWRLPIKKYIPHGEHPGWTLRAQVKKIRQILTPTADAQSRRARGSGVSRVLAETYGSAKVSSFCCTARWIAYAHTRSHFFLESTPVSVITECWVELRVYIVGSATRRFLPLTVSCFASSHVSSQFQPPDSSFPPSSLGDHACFLHL